MATGLTSSFFTHCWTSEGILCQLPLLPSKTVLVGSRSTVQLQNRSPWHREPQYSLVVIIHIDNVTWCSNVSDIEAVEACIRFLSDDDYRSYADTVVWSIILFLLSQVVVKNLSARCTCVTLVNHVVKHLGSGHLTTRLTIWSRRAVHPKSWLWALKQSAVLLLTADWS